MLTIFMYGIFLDFKLHLIIFMVKCVTHSKERSFACRSRPRCVTLSVDLSSVNYERYSGDAGKTVNSGDRSGALCVRDVD